MGNREEVAEYGNYGINIHVIKAPIAMHSNSEVILGSAMCNITASQASK